MQTSSTSRSSWVDLEFVSAVGFPPALGPQGRVPIRTTACTHHMPPCGSLCDALFILLLYNFILTAMVWLCPRKSTCWTFNSPVQKCWEVWPNGRWLGHEAQPLRIDWCRLKKDFRLQIWSLALSHHVVPSTNYDNKKDPHQMGPLSLSQKITRKRKPPLFCFQRKEGKT